MGKVKAIQLSEETAPQLFADDAFPPLPALGPLAKTYEHNAKTTSKDEALCFAICEAVLIGYSKREVSRRFHVSRHTIDAIVDELEKCGKLAPLKKRLSAKAGLLIEESIDAMRENIHDGTMPAQCLPVVAGVLADKKAAWDGEPSQIVGHVMMKDLTPDSVNALLDALPKGNGTIIDIPATVISEAASDSQSNVSNENTK